MASFTLFDKPLYTGIDANTPVDAAAKERTSPVQGVQWQVLTANGLRLNCSTVGALLSWKHTTTPLRSVSYNGQQWRDYEQFRARVDDGQAVDSAFYDAAWDADE